MYLEKTDSEIATLINHEKEREESTINLIASENYASSAVLQATGSVLTNKYAEGYPGKRYYGGCEFIDKIELLAIDRCKQLFNAEHANVQPHAGSQANLAVYCAMLNPGDVIMGMSLSEGGHLTHGHTVNISGKFFKSVQYTVNKESELLDFEEIEQLAQRHKPKLIIAGASAYSRSIDFQKFAEIAKSVGAYFMADIAHIAGLVATGLHPSPVASADFVTSTTHKTLRGPRGGFILCKQQYASKIDRAIMPGIQGGPLMHVIAAKAVGFKEALEENFKDYQQQILKNAQAMVKKFKELDYRIVADGTDNHLFVIDLRSKKINGKQAQELLEKVGITVSRSCIPFDPESPFVTSGIRIGTPAITTRGLKEKESITVVELINETLLNQNNEKKLIAIAQEIKTLCSQFPIY